MGLRRSLAGLGGGRIAVLGVAQCLQTHLHDCKVRRNFAWIAKGPLLQAVQLPVLVLGVDKGRPSLGQHEHLEHMVDLSTLSGWLGGPRLVRSLRQPRVGAIGYFPWVCQHVQTAAVIGHHTCKVYSKPAQLHSSCSIYK